MGNIINTVILILLTITMTLNEEKLGTLKVFSWEAKLGTLKVLVGKRF